MIMFDRHLFLGLVARAPGGLSDAAEHAADAALLLVCHDYSFPCRSRHGPPFPFRAYQVLVAVAVTFAFFRAQASRPCRQGDWKRGMWRSLTSSCV